MASSEYKAKFRWTPSSSFWHPLAEGEAWKGKFTTVTGFKYSTGITITGAQITFYRKHDGEYIAHRPIGFTCYVEFGNLIRSKQISGSGTETAFTSFVKNDFVKTINTYVSNKSTVSIVARATNSSNEGRGGALGQDWSYADITITYRYGYTYSFAPQNPVTVGSNCKIIIGGSGSTDITNAEYNLK